MFYFKIKKQVSLHNRRSFILLLGKLSLFSFVSWKLFNIQILDSKKYRTLSKKNQIKFEILYPLRGDILDRNNIVSVFRNQNQFKAGARRPICKIAILIYQPEKSSGSR